MLHVYNTLSAGQERGTAFETSLGFRPVELLFETSRRMLTFRNLVADILHIGKQQSQSMHRESSSHVRLTPATAKRL